MNAKDKARYNLHYKLRKRGYEISTRDKTIYQNADVTTPPSRLVQRLCREFHYVVQLRIPSTINEREKKVADKMIAEMRRVGFSPDQMLTVIELARVKFGYLRKQKNTLI